MCIYIFFVHLSTTLQLFIKALCDPTFRLPNYSVHTAFSLLYCNEKSYLQPQVQYASFNSQMLSITATSGSLLYQIPVKGSYSNKISRKVRADCFIVCTIHVWNYHTYMCTVKKKGALG